MTYGTRGGNGGVQQFLVAIEELHMRSLKDRLEILIADQDVDESWQLRDLNATLGPYREQVRQLDAQLVEALRQTQPSARVITATPGMDCGRCGVEETSKVATKC